MPDYNQLIGSRYEQPPCILLQLPILICRMRVIDHAQLFGKAGCQSQPVRAYCLTWLKLQINYMQGRFVHGRSTGT